MPEFVAPPPSNEVGAYTQPRTLNRWLDVNRVQRLTRTRLYFIVPAFSITVDYLTYSNLVGAYNYTSDRNFVIVSNDLPLVKSTDYVLCIMWKDSQYKTHRYAFWRGVGEVFYFDAPVYTGQLIKKNFRVEIWTTAVAGPAPVSGDIILDESTLPVLDESGGTIIGDS